MDKKIAELLQGYSKANEFTEAERRAFLARLTPQESMAIFISLWQLGERLNASGGGNLEAVEQRKIAELIKRRRALDRLANRGSKAR